MKKLMIAAAVAAMSTAVFAKDGDPEAQVYDIKATLMSTVPAQGDLDAGRNPFLPLGQKGLVYRTYKTRSYSGVAWGCHCDAFELKTVAMEVPIYDERDVKVGVATNWSGAVIWDDATLKPVWVANGTSPWTFVNAFEKEGGCVEGSWTLNPTKVSCNPADPSTSVTNGGHLVGAGFGYIGNTYDSYVEVTNDVDCADAYVQNMTGWFAGYLPASNMIDGKSEETCVFCRGKKTVQTCKPSTVWDFCACARLINDTLTAAYGQWTIQFNAQNSKILEDHADMLEAFYFNADVSNAVVEARQ